MFIHGHIASGVLIARRWTDGKNLTLFWVVFGSLLPDLIDKSIKLVGLSPYGRTIGHSAIVWLVLGLMAFVLGRSGRGWYPMWVAIGVIGHFAADLVHDVETGIYFTGDLFSAWFGWPVTNPDQAHIHCAPVFPTSWRWTSFSELAVVAAAFLSARRPEASSEAPAD